MKKKTGTVIQITALAVFLCCAFCLGVYYYNGYESNKEFVELRKTVEDAADGEERAENGMLLCYYELYQQNNDMAGWIKIADTKIDYPVVKSADNNEFYLHKNFEKEYQYCGIPFMDHQCDAEKPSDNVIIYAHNMKDGSMFATLLDYENEEFLRAHKTIEFDSLYERGKYEVIYAFCTKPGKQNYLAYCEFIDAGNQEDFYEFIDEIKKLAFYKDEENAPEYGDKLLTLSTCSYNTANERFVVIAKKVK